MQFFHPACGDVYDATILSPPTELPPRSHARSLSPYYLLSSGKKVNVPWSAIVRDRPAIELDDAVALVPRNCFHGNVVVLRAIDTDGDQLYGWFVKRQSHLLQRLTKRIIIQIGMTCNAVRPSSSLVTCFIDAIFTNSTVDFESLAVVRFERKRSILGDVASNQRKTIKKRSSRPTRPTRARSARIAKKGVDEHETTCVVCMEDFTGFVERPCGKCTTPVCQSCSDRMRGMCAVCDRSKLNAHYECHGCGGLEDLKHSGFPCVTCGENVLCAMCYRAYDECYACDPLA
tara:strand:- start:1317 stop:2180 length:864 start_codon:yes stop_codon:yes gene_type:complete